MYIMSVRFLAHKWQLYMVGYILHVTDMHAFALCVCICGYMLVRRMQELLLTEQAAAVYTVVGLCSSH